MKTLFKNLMLVAVAAMAFTACTETNEEVNAVVEKTVLKFVAGFDEETRSGFVGSVTEGEKTLYKSAWDGNETLKVCATGEFASAQQVVLEDAEGHFTVEFEGTAPTSIDVYSPASAWISEGYPTVPAVQTPRANSVDPAAHLLYAKNQPVESGVVTMSHKLAYGKMTVKDVDFAIDHVVVDIKGTYYGYDCDMSYTINATYVKNNEFWFAVEYAVAVSSLTVTAYGAGDEVVTKTVDMAGKEKPLAFNVGRVSTFSVSDLVAVVEPEEPEGLVFTSASVTASSGDAYAYFTTANGDVLQLNPYYVFVDDTWPIGTHVIKANYGYVYPGLGQGYSTFKGIDVEGGEIVVSVKNNKYYIEFNNLVDGNSNILIEKGIFEGEITGLQVPDGRTPLATPSVTATAEGNIITLSWDAVTGAESYYVFCASSSSISPITTTDTTVTIEAAYSTAYEFMVTAQAADADPNFKSSEAKTIKVSTEKDPNKFADVVATDIQWNTSGYFTLTVPGFSYFYLEVNSANRPNNNSLVVGDYTYGKNENQFRIRYNNGSLYTWTDHNTNLTTMNVSFVDGQYVILINVSSLYSGFVGTIGYKGMPDGWVAPSAGESGGEEPDPDQPEGGEEPETPAGPGNGTQNDPYKLTLEAMSADSYVNYDFVTADGIKFHLETNWTSGTQAGNFTFGGTSDPIPAKYCAVNGEFGSTVGTGGYVNFTNNGSTWRIDMLVPYVNGEFYAYYEGSLDR